MANRIDPRTRLHMGGTAMLMDLLNKAVPVAMVGFVVSSMLAMGLGLTIRADH